jgi:hypothetical protein
LARGKIFFPDIKKNRYAERTCARYQYGSADLA